MNAAEHLLESQRAASELSTLSRDPALAARPDPAFCPKFRNADEIGETDSEQVHGNSRLLSAISARWGSASSWRRCPKD